MLAVSANSTWIQGDAVCLGCGVVAELVGAPRIQSGAHDICDAPCKRVIEKLCVRNDFLSARVKELQQQMRSGQSLDDGAASKNPTTTQSYTYTAPSGAVQTAPLRVPVKYQDGTTQTQKIEFTKGTNVVVRDRSTEQWRKGVVTDSNGSGGRVVVRVPGIGEHTWGHIQIDGHNETPPHHKNSTVSKPTQSEPEIKSTTNKISGLDLLTSSELADMVKTVSELKTKVDKLQAENTRLTTQLNTATTDKTNLTQKITAEQTRKETLEYLNKVQLEENSQLSRKIAELATLRSEKTRLENDLSACTKSFEATLSSEISVQQTVAAITARVQNLLRTQAQVLQARKMAAVSSPDEFKKWLLQCDPHLALLSEHPCKSKFRKMRNL
eukprot:TRINITY_DN15001_c0_g1_i1.p1 TRINITY_DN15001_c0_g1~~TRINITY_DN15001_c0_g1_i1.p1  ORF type:complete len:383 (+),score=67.08 TRINITY_DN15001_c0_g1_i1:105-1253(+)